MKRGKGNRVIFDKKEIKFLKDNFLKIPVKTLAAFFKVSQGVIRRVLKENNLIIPSELAEQRKRASMYKVGSVPMNKGKKQEDYLTATQIRNIKKTQFKKGNIPHNKIYKEHHISIRKDSNGTSYKWLKISDKEWVALHVYNYKKVHGSIPEGMMVVFKNGDTLNCNIENLECISKKENLIRNRKKYFELPIALRETMKIIKSVEKEISK